MTDRNKETKDNLKPLIFLAISIIVIGLFCLGLILNFDASLDKEELKNVLSCDNISEHPEQYEFKTTQKDRFDECVKWYNEGGHIEYIKNGRQMSLLFKIMPVIGIPMIVIIVFRMFKQHDKMVEKILKKQYNKCIRCSSTISKDDGWFGGLEEQGWCERCAISLGFDKEKTN